MQSEYANVGKYASRQKPGTPIEGRRAPQDGPASLRPAFDFIDLIDFIDFIEYIDFVNLIFITFVLHTKCEYPHGNVYNVPATRYNLP